MRREILLQAILVPAEKLRLAHASNEQFCYRTVTLRNHLEWQSTLRHDCTKVFFPIQTRSMPPNSQATFNRVCALININGERALC
jgi:hypothetical protein